MTSSITHTGEALFLIFYGLITGLIVIGYRFFLSHDPTTKLPAVAVPSELDPYEIAYLCGGERQVLELAGFSLLQKGYLEIDRGKLQRAESSLESPQLKPIEHKALEWFFHSRRVEGFGFIYADELQANVRQDFEGYRQWLRNEKLLFLEQDRTTALKVAACGAGIIVILGGYELIESLPQGYPYWGILEFIAFVGISWLVYGFQRSQKRLSERGKKYVKHLQECFDLSKLDDVTHPSAEHTNMLMMKIALSGLKVLQKTPYEDYPKLFIHPVVYSTSYYG